MRSFLKTKLPRYSIRKIGTVAVSVMTAMSVFTPSIAQASTGDESSDNSSSTVTQNTDNSSNGQQTTGKGTGTGSTGTGKGTGTGKPDNNVTDNEDALKQNENNEKGSETETQRADTKGITESMNVSDSSSHTQVSADMIGASEVVTDGSQLSKSDDLVYQQAMKDKADKEKQSAVDKVTGDKITYDEGIFKDKTKLDNHDYQTIGDMAKYMESENALGIAGIFHIFANKAKQGADLNGNIATNELISANDFGTRENNRKVDNTEGDINYFKKIDDLGPNAFRNDAGSKVIVGEHIESITGNGQVIAKIGGKDYHFDHIYNNGKKNVEFEEDANYINIQKELDELSKKSTIWMAKQQSEGVKESFSDMNNRFIDLSEAKADANDYVYVNVPAEYLEAPQPIYIKGIDDIKPQTIIFNVIGSQSRTQINYQTQIKLTYKNNKTPASAESHEVKNCTLWNFGTDITNINIYSGYFMGSILATKATINAGVNIDGNIVGNEVNISGGETHRWDLQPNGKRFPEWNNTVIPPQPTKPTIDDHEQPTKPTSDDHKQPTKPTTDDHKQPTKPTNDDHKQPTKPTSDDHKQPTKPTADDHEQPTKPISDDHKQPTKPTTDDHKQPTKPTTDDHKQPTKPTNDDHKQPTKPTTDDHKQPTKPTSDDHKQPTKPEQPTNVVPPKGEDKPKNSTKNDQPSISSKNHHDDNNIPPKSDNPTVPTNNTDVSQTPSNDVPPKADIPTTPLTPSDDDDFYPSLNKSQKSPSSPATFAPLSKQSFKKNKSNTKKNSKMTYFAAQSKKTLNGKQRKTEFNDLTVREAKKSEDNTIDLIAKKSEKNTNFPKQTVSKHQAALPQTGAKKGFAIAVLGMALTVLSFGLIKLSKREN